MTTNKGSLDDHKLEYELTEGDPKKTVPKAVQTSTMRIGINKDAFKKRPKRQGIIKSYFKYMVEVILK